MIEPVTETTGFNVVYTVFVPFNEVEKILDTSGSVWDQLRGEYRYRNTIAAIKKVRERWCVGLKDAKEIVEYVMERMDNK